MSAVNVSDISIGFLLVSLVTNRVSLEEECLPSLEVLNLAASCLDDENEIPLKVIASFFAVRFDLPSIPLLVLHGLVRSVFWSMFSTKSLQFFFCLCSQMRFWMSLFSLDSSDDVGSLLRRSSRLVITSSISAATGSSWSMCRPVGMWCDAALSRIVRKIFSSLRQSVGRERLLRAASTSCLYLSQLAFFGLTPWVVASMAGSSRWGPYSNSADDGCSEKVTDLWMKITSCIILDAGVLGFWCTL